MAEVLAIVAEAGIHGMEYNGLLESWLNRPHSRSSTRSRISPLAAPRFSGREFENYLILAWRFGFVERSRYKEVDWKAGLNKSSYEIENEIVRLTEKGWNFVVDNRATLLEKWFDNILSNVPSIVVAVLLAWAVSVFGPTN